MGNIQVLVKKVFSFLVIFSVIMAVLPGCDDSSDEMGYHGSVVVATIASDWSSGAHSVVTSEKPRTAVNKLLATISDITIVANGKYFYRIDKKNGNIIKFQINRPATPVWQYSTQTQGESTANPYDMIFASETKAYLLRYNTSKIWVVNPSATTEANFKIGEIDLSVYNDNNNSDQPTPPDMACGLVKGERLYVCLQRIYAEYGSNLKVSGSYIAVFDIANDEEIDTEKGEGELKGIKLRVQNPVAIASNNTNVFVAGQGDTFGSVTTVVGIEKISLVGYSSSLIAEETKVTDVEITADGSKGYFVVYAGWGDNQIKSFNTATGNVYSKVTADITGRSINDIEIDSKGMLWVADSSSSDPGLYIVNTTDDTLDEGPVSTALNPVKIAFCDEN